MRCPRIGREDLVVERPADKAAQSLVRVDCARRLAWIGPRLQRPDHVVVLGDERAERCLVVPGDAKGLQDVARMRAEVDHVALHYRVLPVEPNAEALTHAAAAAIAPREIGAA